MRGHKMRGPKMKNASFQLAEEQLRYMRRMSHRLSIELNKEVSFSDLMREAVEKTFPMVDEKEGNQ